MKCDIAIYVVSFAYLLLVVTEKVVGENDYLEFESIELEKNLADEPESVADNFQDDDNLLPNNFAAAIFENNDADTSTSATSNFAPNNFAGANFQGDKFPNNFAAGNFKDDDPKPNFVPYGQTSYFNPRHQQQPTHPLWFGGLGLGPVTPNGSKSFPRPTNPKIEPYTDDPNVKISGYSFGYQYTTDKNGKVVVSPLGAPRRSSDFPSSFGHQPISGALSGSSRYDEEFWNPRNRFFKTDNIRKSDRMFGFDDKSPNTHRILENGPEF